MQTNITLNSAYNEVAFNEKSAIMKENLCTKYTLFTYNDVTLNEKPPITKQNLHIFFHYRWSWVYITHVDSMQNNITLLMWIQHKTILHYPWELANQSYPGYTISQVLIKTIPNYPWELANLSYPGYTIWKLIWI